MIGCLRTRVRKQPTIALHFEFAQVMHLLLVKVRKRAKIRNRYNQAPHLAQDANGKVTTSQLDITNESQEVSPFPTGDHKASSSKWSYYCSWTMDLVSVLKKSHFPRNLAICSFQPLKEKISIGTIKLYIYCVQSVRWQTIHTKYQMLLAQK